MFKEMHSRVRTRILSKETGSDNSDDEDALAILIEQHDPVNVPKSKRNDVEFTMVCETSYKLARCSKKHHHHGLIPMSELKVGHLPVGHQSYDILNSINQIGRAVVEIRVAHISKRRRHEFPGLSDSVGLIRQGSGWIGRISHDEIETIPCQYPNCSARDTHCVIGPFFVMTARHLVFDKSEAQATTVKFGDDYSENESAESNYAFGVDIAYTEADKRDFVFVKCYSHDMSIIPQLVSISKNISKALDNLHWSEKQTPAIGLPSVGLIISHPHGCAKHISFGSLRENDSHEEERELEFDMKTGEKRAGIVRYTYDIPTCPGSSGAVVCIMSKELGCYHYLAPHSRYKGGELGCTEVLVERREPVKEVGPVSNK